MKKILTLVSFLLVLVTLTACNRNDINDENVVYITVYPMQFLVEQIAGDTVDVKIVPGASAHGESVEWSAKEIIDMSDADLLFFINGGADNYIPTKASLFEGENVMLVDMSQHIEYNEICLSNDEHDEEENVPFVCDENSTTPDPHFWLDPVRMLQAAEFVKDKLISTYPSNQELYNNKYTVLEALLTQLDQEYQDMALEAVLPVMTTVRLFTYYQLRYGIEIHSITNDIHTAESNPGMIIEFVEYAVANDVMYIIFEKNSNSPAGEQVLDGLQDLRPDAGKLELHGLGAITVAETEAGATYITIMYNNLEVLKLSTK